MHDLARLKAMLQDKPVHFQTKTANYDQGALMIFEDEEARRRAQRTLEHFKKRGIVPGEQS